MSIEVANSPAIDQLRPIVDVLTIDGPHRFTLAGESIEVPPVVAPVPGYERHPLPEHPLVRALQATLYERVYTRTFGAGPLPWIDEHRHDPFDFAAKLMAANDGADRWDAGWTVYQVGPQGEVYLQKGECETMAGPGDYSLLGAPGLGATIGATVALRVAASAHDVQPGLYFAYGETPNDRWDDASLVRFYFHCSPSAAVEVLAGITRDFNRFEVPFRFKTLWQPAAYVRNDAAVLYVAKRYVDIVVRLLRPIVESLGTPLHPDTSVFTQQILPGVGVAEEPETGESFGMHCCRLLAEALVESWETGRHTTDERLATAARHFGQQNLDLARPYLRADSFDRYRALAPIGNES